MKFKGNGLVWDKEKGQVLCRFEDGEYEAKEKREQELLKDLGYEKVESKKVKPDGDK